MWATNNLLPDLTIVLDVDPVIGLTRITNPDRLEAEPLAYHELVRAAFLEIANGEPERYLVIDANRAVSDIAAEVSVRVDLLMQGRQ
jgi:dTMP kinase